MEKTEIGVYIEALRLKKGMSQRELAKESGVSHTEINRIEGGEREKPSAKTLAKLSGILNVSNEKLLIVAGYLQHHEIMAAHDLRNYEDITPEIQAAIKKEVEKAWAEKERENK